MEVSSKQWETDNWNSERALIIYDFRFFRGTLRSFLLLNLSEQEGWQILRVEERYGDKQVLQFCNQFVQEWVASVSAGAGVN